MRTGVVSIIIPSYNYGHFIDQTLHSILEQSYPHWECIVVDDGSTDNTRDVVLAIQDSRIRYIYQDNAERSAARNRGVRESSGEFFMFLDADDVLRRNHLGALVECFADDIGIVFCDTEKFIETEHSCECIPFPTTEAGEGPIPADEMYRLLFSGNQLTLHSGLIRRKVMEAIGGFDTGKRFYEDYEFWLIAAGKGFNFYHLKRPIALYRIHGNSTVGSDAMIVVGRMDEFAILHTYYRPELLENSFRQSREISLYEGTIRELLQKGYRKEVRPYIYNYFHRYGYKRLSAFLHSLAYLLRSFLS